MGAPLYEWKLDAKTGEIVEATRQVDSASERIIERSVNPSTLKNEEVQKALDLMEQNKPDFLKEDTTVAVAVAVATEASSTDQATPAPTNWDSLDMQRDIAFKIVYFFIVFILATFGLLYAYFQMNKKEMKEEEERNQIKHLVRNKNFGQGQDHTFFDFLAGNVDEEQYAMRAENTSTTSNSARNHRQEDSGFGSANLEHLGEQPVFYQ